MIYNFKAFSKLKCIDMLAQWKVESMKNTFKS